MVLSDFLSRQKTDDSKPLEIMPVSFNMREVLQENYYNLGNTTEGEKYLVQTRSQGKSSGIKVPEGHGIEKSLVPYVKPERLKSIVRLPIDKRLPTDSRLPIPKPRPGQGRARIGRKARVVPPTPTPIQTPAPKAVQSLLEPVEQSQGRVQPEHPVPFQTPISQPTGPTSITQPIGPRFDHGLTLFNPDPILRLLPRPSDSNDTRKDLLDLDTDRNINFEENLPCYEGIISEHMKDQTNLTLRSHQN